MGRFASLVSAAEERRLQSEVQGFQRSIPGSSREQVPQQQPLEQQVPQQPLPQSPPQQPPAEPLKSKDMANPTPTLGEPGPRYFKPPGYVEDITDLGPLRGWSSLIDDAIEKIVLSKSTNKRVAGKKLHFFNPAREMDTPQRQVSVKWRAFPKNLDHTPNKWQEADKRENQDEYCEWEVKRNAAGDLLSVTFTTEVPEYYAYLATLDDNAEQLLNIYNSFAEGETDDVTKEELLSPNGTYNKENTWNIRPKDGLQHHGSIAHLLRPNNTLLAIVHMVVEATILVPDPEHEGKYLTKYHERLKYLPKVSAASAQRNSDPVIADRINDLVREGKRVTVANPLGPYIEVFEEKIRGPNGQQVRNLWRVERSGTDNHAVRARFTVPRKLVGQLQDERGNKIKYGSQIAQYVWVAVQVAVAAAEPPEGTAAPPQILSYIEGRQVKPALLPAAFINREMRREPFGYYLATTPEPAVTLKGLLERLPDQTWIAYAADEGIGYDTRVPRKEVRVRLVIICTPQNATRRPENGSRMADPESMTKIAFKRPTYAIVAVAPRAAMNNVHHEASILQVASFNPDDGWFNFYDRERHGAGIGAGKWMYFGSSKDAFTPDTQGLGPFCGHANGTLIMKESEDPWPHWHTAEYPLRLPDDHEMMRDPLFRDPKAGWYFGEADHLARMVEIATKTWFTKRRFLDFGPIRKPDEVAKRVHQWVAHVCLNTTLTLSCSKGGNTKFPIPSGFFFNTLALSLVIPDMQDLEDNIISCSMTLYKDAKKTLGLSTLNSMKKTEGKYSNIASESEGAAPWKVIVPSKEDVEGIRQILDTRLLPKRVVLALLMVDFWNPLFSHRRARLMRYVPSEANYSTLAASTDDRYELGKDLVAAVDYAKISLGLSEKSPEAEFLRLVRLENPEEEAKGRIQKFVEEVNAKLATPEGVLGYLKVAESKRRLFRPPPKTRRSEHPLAEFETSLPYSTMMPDDEVWEMQEDGSVVQEHNSLRSTWHPRNSQAPFSSSGCPFSASF